LEKEPWRQVQCPCSELWPCRIESKTAKVSEIAERKEAVAKLLKNVLLLGGRYEILSIVGRQELNMDFRFYRNAISQASKKAAAGLFVTGLLLIGFGLLVYVLRDLFAMLASLVFFVGGVGCGITAIKIFLAQRKLNKMSGDDSGVYRENVEIHGKEHYD